MSFQKTALGRLLCAAVALAAPLPALAEIPAGYPADYADIVAKAEAEGAVVIYANTEHAAVEPILADFQKAFPKIRADYIEIKAADLFSRVSSEAAAGALKADVVWSSAMDLQYQMVEDGIAAGEFVASDPQAVAQRLVAAIDGVGLRVLVDDPRMGLAHARRLVVDQLAAQLGTTPEAFAPA